MLLLVRLSFKSPLSIGGTNGDDEFGGIIHSDTIFSAIINEWVRMYPEDDVDDIVETRPFELSSAFPYDGGEYYLPTPIGTGSIYIDKLKDQPFLELYDFLDLAEGNVRGISKKELQNPVENMLFRLTAPRVTLDRLTAASNLFETTAWRFKEGSGLYFLLKCNKPNSRSKVEVCLKMLCGSGLGGERSVGYGLFEYEIAEIGKDDVWSSLFQVRKSENKIYCTLSLVCPQKEEAQNAVSYSLMTRKGWIFSRSSNIQMKRRACRMFREGSLFSELITGQIAKVTPGEFTDHVVWRYGLGMMVTMSVKGTLE